MVKKKKAIRILCFQRFSIQVKNTPIVFKNKKAEELLAYLVCSQDLLVNKTTLASTLWPESSDHNSLNSLYKVVEWLQAFAVPEIASIIEAPRGKILLNKEGISCDLWKFDAFYHHKSIPNWKAAVELYRGILYYEEGYSWAFLYEGAYDIKYFEMLEYLTAYYRKKGDPLQASYYQNLLENA